MTDDTIRLETRPEITAFIDAVCERLSDLPAGEREELVGGLEGDLAELVADGGSVSELGDPRAYADELRAAAGIARPSPAPVSGGPRVVRARAGWRPAGDVERLLDGARHRWEEVVAAPALQGIWQFVVSLRPLWWVLRAWLAAQVLAAVVGTGVWPSLVPAIGGAALGVLVLLVAVVVSVQIGRGRIWPGAGPDRTPAARVLLLVLNAFAILVSPMISNLVYAESADDERFATDPEQSWAPGLVVDGDPVSNVFPYDAEGNPLTGVQLFDEDGDPLSVDPYAGDEWVDGERLVGYPWFNGEQRLYNVFPLPRRVESDAGLDGGDPDAWTSARPPYLPEPPLADVPSASLPGTGADIADPDRGAGVRAEDGAGGDAGREGEVVQPRGPAGQRDSEKPAGR